MRTDPPFLFVDFDETLSDAVAFNEQYLGELGRILSDEVGGAPDAWAAAVTAELPARKARYLERFRGGALDGYNAWLEEERARVTEAVFERVGHALPTGEAVDAFARRVEFDALICCHAPFPGAEQALRVLFEQGVRVQMASSQESQFLLASLIGAGIESYIESKFGPDLVDCAKEGPEFYRRIFEASGVAAADAIVLDDQAVCLRWAEEAGARVIHACLSDRSEPPAFTQSVRSLSELPGLMRQMAAGD